MEPSVKGSILVASIVGVRRLRDSGQIDGDQLAARLGGAALDLLDQKIDMSRWYPVEVFAETMDLFWEIDGGRDPDYMRRMGQEQCARFFESQVYQQLDYARRAQHTRLSRGHDALLRQTRLINSITSALYNFLEYENRIIGDRLQIIYGNAGRFNDAMRYSTEGFMIEINRQRGRARPWTSERVKPDTIVFEMELPEWVQGS